MNRRVPALAVILLAGTSAFAHRLDEYLQGTLISIDEDQVEGQLTLTPGVSVAPLVLAAIGEEGGSVIPETKQRAYAKRVLSELSLTIEGETLTPHLISFEFPSAEEMESGRGEIRIQFAANLPSGGPHRKLVMENHHLSGIAAYQVNCLVPRDPAVRILAQHRNYLQSRYEVDFEQAGSPSTSLWLPLLSNFQQPWVLLPVSLFALHGLARKRHK